MRGVGLRARLVAAFVAVVALTTVVASLVTSYGLHRSLDDYLERRTDDAARSAVTLAEDSYAATGRWTPEQLDLLAHELVLTGYDFRLVARGRALLDTTKLEGDGGTGFREVTRLPVRDPAGAQVATLDLYALGPRGDLPADDELRGQLDRAHLVAAIVAGVVAIAAGLIMAGRLSRPLRGLAAAARGIAAGAAVPEVRGGSPEVRELSHSLQGLAQDLERQRRARRQLAQDLSHELRTPLMLLQSRIEAMQDGIVGFDAANLSALHTESLRLSGLIGQIERLAEAEAQPPPLRREEIRLDEIAHEACEALAAAFEAGGRALAVEAAPAPAWGDREAVLQVLLNLLTNALKYAPDGTPVTLTTDTEGDWAVARVDDAGTGMPEAERRRVFERFYRGSGAAERSGGAGLGLTIARGLAEGQGGRLELERADGRGTSFVLRLPGRPSPARGAEAPPARPGRSPVAGSGR